MKESFSLSEIKTSTTKFVNVFDDKPLLLENGEQLSSIKVAYQTYGVLNEEGTNAILVCHALTGNSHAAGIVGEEEIENTKEFEFLSKYNKMYLGKPGWWDPLIGPGKAFDTNKYFVVCSNVLGSCYGTLGPADVSNLTAKKFRKNFPAVTVRDMVKVQKSLIDYLGIKRLKTIVGGSLGGMQVLEWATMYGNIVESIIPIATSAGHSAWAMGLNRASRIAIENDPNYRNGNYDAQPIIGFSLARQIAIQTYRTYSSFENKFGRTLSDDKNNGTKELFEVESYLEYQGKKLVNRFDANAYLYLSKAMDSHDVGLNRGGIENALRSITAKTLCIGIDSDILYPAEEQIKLSKMIPNSSYAEISSEHGHDAFLIEFDQLGKIVNEFLEN
jgi:homoserine O-acetyltransferase/O-succinyltransferase